MVRAERDFLDRPPPVEEEVSGFAPLEVVAKLPPGAGPLLLVSGDDGYCRRFAELLLAFRGGVWGGGTPLLSLLADAPR